MGGWVGGQVGSKPCGTEMGMLAVCEPAWELPGYAQQAELSTELHPGIFLIRMSKNTSFNQNCAAAQQENLNRNH